VPRRRGHRAGPGFARFRHVCSARPVCGGGVPPSVRSVRRRGRRTRTKAATMVTFNDGLAETAPPSTAVVETDVLIVGSGPAGASAALFLSTLGVSNTMITKYRWTANTPRAHITNQRTMEIFRDLGIEDEVLADATPHHLIGDTVFCTAIAGEEIGRILTWGNRSEEHTSELQSREKLACRL